jgi:O-antigen ligase/tetratricopeptide (TPR) repeat protein
MKPPISTAHGRHRRPAGPSRRFRRQVEQNVTEPAHSRFEAFLLGLMDAALAGCILVVPFMMGGRHPIGQTVLVALTSIVVVAWALRQTMAKQGIWRPTYAALVLLLGVILVAFQLVPLSQEWLARLSPETTQLLSLWKPGTDPSIGLGTWNQISLTPDDTRAGLIVFVCYAFLFLATVQRIERIEDVERILRWCAVAAILMAGFGLIQYISSNGKFLWFYQSPYISADRNVQGTFTNRNHFAHFLALGIGPLIWWLYRIGESTKNRDISHVNFYAVKTIGRWLLVLAIVLVAFASLLSLSRGGNSVFLMAAIIAAVVCGRVVALQGRFLLAIAAAGVLVVVSLHCFGYQKVSDRLSDLSSGSISRLDGEGGRRMVWKAVASAVPDFALFGSGVGSHCALCPIYLDTPLDGVVFTHAENSPLQATLETGLIGSTLMAAGIGFCAFWCIAGLWRGQSTRAKACLGAIAASLVASLVHGTVDFVWYVPGCMAIVAVLAALACRCWQMNRPSDKSIATWRLPRAVALAIAAFMAIVSVDMVSNRFRATVAQHYWEHVCITSRVAARQARKQKDLSPEQLWQRELDLEKQLQADLEQVVRWCPGHAKAQLELARCHLSLFDLFQAKSPNPMPLPAIRDAAIKSHDYFASLKEQDQWLQRACGEHRNHLYFALRHTRAALRQCPLYGRGYLYLAELCFLEGGVTASKQACLNQALNVRPSEGDVLGMVVMETCRSLMSGDCKSWLPLAQRAIHSKRSAKKQVIETFVGGFLPENQGIIIEFIVTLLKPDLEGLDMLHQAAMNQYATDEQLKPLRQYLAQSAEFEAKKADTTEATRVWLLAADVYIAMGNRADSLRCVRNAYKRNSGNLDVRYRLACLLLEEGAGDEACTHLMWCLRRAPDNKWYQKKYREAVDAAGKQPRKTATRHTPSTR